MWKVSRQQQESCVINLFLEFHVNLQHSCIIAGPSWNAQTGIVFSLSVSFTGGEEVFAQGLLCDKKERKRLNIRLDDFVISLFVKAGGHNRKYSCPYTGIKLCRYRSRVSWLPVLQSAFQDSQLTWHMENFLSQFPVFHFQKIHSGGKKNKQTHKPTSGHTEVRCAFNYEIKVLKLVEQKCCALRMLCCVVNVRTCIWTKMLWDN